MTFLKLFRNVCHHDAGITTGSTVIGKSAAGFKEMMPVMSTGFMKPAALLPMTVDPVVGVGVHWHS